MCCWVLKVQESPDIMGPFRLKTQRVGIYEIIAYLAFQVRDYNAATNFIGLCTHLLQAEEIRATGTGYVRSGAFMTLIHVCLDCACVYLMQRCLLAIGNALGSLPVFRLHLRHRKNT